MLSCAINLTQVGLVFILKRLSRPKLVEYDLVVESSPAAVEKDDEM